MNERDILNVKKLAKKAAKQGNHRQNISNFLRAIIEETRNEFKEDNHTVINHYLRNVFEEALNL